MKTVFRVYQDKDGSFGGQTMISHLSFNERLQIIGMIETLSHNLKSEIEFEDMSESEVDEIRDLLDDTP